MNDDLKNSIVEWMQDRADVVGFAPVDRFDQAPEAHHPSRIVKGAKTVIVFGKTIPRAILSSPDYNLYLLHRSYHSVYTYLDQLGMDLANYVESRGQHLALQIPTFAPLVYEGIEPWGILSLKHAAVNAGIAAFGKTGLVYHKEYGSLLRLGAVVTSAEVPGDPIIEDDPCPPGCNACSKACPSGALKGDSFEKLTCMGYTVKHAIYPLALKEKADLKHIERIINTAAYNYWLECDECLRVCPNNHKKKV